MKRKIALFANGWNGEYLSIILSGIQQCALEENLDLFLFINYAAYSDSKENTRGENHIFHLPELSGFDGAVVFGNILHSEEAITLINKKIADAGIPAISLERELPNMDYIGACNYPGMYELAEHLMTKHSIKNAVYLGGPKEHAESKERLQAVRDAFQKYGTDIAEENIYYGDFSSAKAVELTKQIINEQKKLPDVIICANDYSAMGAVIALEQMEISVPERILVTGFDGVEMGQIFYPSITTVGREWDKMGYRCIRHLLKQINGQNVKSKEVLHTKFAKAESCGCGINRKNLNRRKCFCREGYQTDMENITFEWSINDMEQAFSDTNGIKKMDQTLETYFQQHSELTGEDFYMIFEEGFGMEDRGSKAVSKSSYGEKMHVALAIEQGKIKKHAEFLSKQLVPGYNGKDDQSHIFAFLPMHYREKPFGYLVFKDNIKMISNQRMFTWMSRLNRELEWFRQREE